MPLKNVETIQRHRIELAEKVKELTGDLSDGQQNVYELALRTRATFSGGRIVFINQSSSPSGATESEWELEKERSSGKQSET